MIVRRPNMSMLMFNDKVTTPAQLPQLVSLSYDIHLRS